MQNKKKFKFNSDQILYARGVILYLIALCFGYPYGLTLIGDVNFRIPDVIALLLILLGGLLLLKIKRVLIKPFIVILPFLILEIILPIIGGVFQTGFWDITSGFRILLLYMPLLLYFMLYGLRSQEILDDMVYKTLKWIVILNMLYCFIQFLVLYDVLSMSVLLENYLVRWAVDSHYSVIDGLRASGFFINSTSLSIFGLISMAYFLSKYIKFSGRKNLFYILASLVLIIASTSRTAYLIAFVFIIIAIFLNFRKSFKLIGIGTIVIIAVIIIINNTLGVEEYFSRFLRLDDGLENDYSLNLRAQVIWPYVLNNLSSYPVGTLVPPTDIFGVIDSGYLTYYAQGKWLFIASLVLLFSLIIFKYTTKFIRKDSWSVIFLIFIMLYIMSAMMISNPMRSPIVIFFLIYALFLAGKSFNYNNSKIIG